MIVSHVLSLINLWVDHWEVCKKYTINRFCVAFAVSELESAKGAENGT